MNNEIVKDTPKFSDLIKELKNFDKEIMFSFQEYNDSDKERFNYVNFTFGFSEIDEYFFTINFKNNEIEFNGEFLDYSLSVDELEIIGSVGKILKDYFELIKETFRG